MIASLIKLAKRFISLKPIKKIIRGKKMTLIYYRDPKRSKILKVINKIKDSKYKVQLYTSECMQICSAVISTAKIPGDIAEVGVYRGGSAELICNFKGNKNLYLFDLFEEGLRDVEHIDNKSFYEKEYNTLELKNGMYAFQEKLVKERLKSYPNVYTFKGYFPETADVIKKKTFSFVNLDVDTYKSTLACLNFFYPRMSPGGIIISHDYFGVEGVKKAFQEFFDNQIEPLIELSGTQVLVVKLK